MEQYLTLMFFLVSPMTVWMYFVIEQMTNWAISGYIKYNAKKLFNIFNCQPYWLRCLLFIVTMLIFAKPTYFILDLFIKILLTPPSPQLFEQNKAAYQRCLKMYGPYGCYPIICHDIYDC